MGRRHRSDYGDAEGDRGHHGERRAPIFLLWAQRRQRLGERCRGGPGGEENGEQRHGDTAMVVGVEVDDTFAESPLLLLFFYFPVSF